MTDTTDEVLRIIADLREAGRPCALATVVRTAGATSAKAGAKAVITEDGALEGWIGGGCTRGAVSRAAAEVLQSGQARLISVRPKESLATADADDEAGVALHASACPSGGTVDIFVEPLLPRPLLIVCGASPVARALAELAPRLGFAVAQAARAEDLESLPPTDLRCAGFDLAAALPASDYIVVATQGTRDLDALKGALASGARYVAFVGSRRKFATLRQRLAAAGVAESDLARVASPAGLDIGAITPDEIALSILAQAVAVRRQGARDTAPIAAATSGTRLSGKG